MPIVTRFQIQVWRYSSRSLPTVCFVFRSSCNNNNVNMKCIILHKLNQTNFTHVWNEAQKFAANWLFSDDFIWQFSLLAENSDIAHPLSFVTSMAITVPSVICWWKCLHVEGKKLSQVPKFQKKKNNFIQRIIILKSIRKCEMGVCVYAWFPILHNFRHKNRHTLTHIPHVINFLEHNSPCRRNFFVLLLSLVCISGALFGMNSSSYPIQYDRVSFIYFQIAEDMKNEKKNSAKTTYANQNCLLSQKHKHLPKTQPEGDFAMPCPF